LITVEEDEKKIPIVVFNPLPWKRKDIANFNVISNTKKAGFKNPEAFKIFDSEGNEIAYQYVQISEEPRYRLIGSVSYYCSFLAEVPACGYRCYYINSTKST
jgi:hypothetical protein